MLARSDFPVADAFGLLARHGIDAALLVPTATGLAKSIMDATGSLREYLEDRGYHRFDEQGQGPENKVKRSAYFVRPGSLQSSTVSLYRPNTKSGDPRIWLGAATRENAQAHNLLALTVQGDDLYVLNMSDAAVRASLADPASPFRRVLDANRVVLPAVDELLDRLRGISARGFIQTMRAGDTGVGMTLETLLGIAANSRAEPDFKGIELKAKRRRGSGKANRSTLFSKAPKWKLSPVGSAMGLLRKRGYVDPDTDRLQLYHTVSGNYVNSRGLLLEVDGAQDWLKQVHVDQDTKRAEHDTTWLIGDLKDCLATKHRETFWVQATCRGSGADEHFHYVEVMHTRAPMIRNFPALLEAGVVTVDYLLKLEGGRAHDHGYLFKIHPANMDALFPPPEVHALS